MEDKNGWIDQNTPDCIGLGAVRTGGITSDVPPGTLVGSGVED